MASNPNLENNSVVKSKARHYSKKTVRELRRVIILIVGLTVMLIGILLLVLPGPGMVILVFGLTILASEFYWAKKWLNKVETSFGSVKNRMISVNKKFR